MKLKKYKGLVFDPYLQNSEAVAMAGLLSLSKEKRGGTLGSSHISTENLAHILCLRDQKRATKGGAGWVSVLDYFSTRASPVAQMVNNLPAM